eukprot:1147322-Pelagomonas_calceolata.AAC.13
MTGSMTKGTGDQSCTRSSSSSSSSSSKDNCRRGTAVCEGAFRDGGRRVLSCTCSSIDNNQNEKGAA